LLARNRGTLGYGKSKKKVFEGKRESNGSGVKGGNDLKSTRMSGDEKFWSIIR